MSTFPPIITIIEALPKVIDPSLAVQAALVERLKNTFPQYGEQILAIDKSGLPDFFPAIIVGEAVELFPDGVNDFHIRVTCDIHVWAEETNLASAKKVAALVRQALRTEPWEIEKHRCAQLRLESARFMRDPGGKHSHGILSLLALLQEDNQPS